MKLAISLIRRDGGTQPRASLDYSVVQSYSEDMQAGAAFPPVVVFHDGSAYWLADGFHRVLAAETGHFDEIEAEVRQGNQRDAILYSVGVNSAHGLRRTNEDKRRAVMRLLDDEEWSRWSDRAIAENCAVSHTFVQTLRKEVTGNGCQSTERKGQDGRTINTANIGKTRAPDPVVNEMPLDDEEPEEPPRRPHVVTPEPEPPTPPEQAIKSLRNYIDVILDEIDGENARHMVVNETIKYLRSLSVAFNQSA